MIPDYLFVSGGDMYDTRSTNWALKPIRTAYQQHFSTITTVAQLKASVRAGPFGWPGGYPIAFICDDGAELCCNCVRQNFRQIAEAIASNARNGWHVVGCDTPQDESGLKCEQCGAPFL